MWEQGSTCTKARDSLLVDEPRPNTRVSANPRGYSPFPVDVCACFVLLGDYPVCGKGLLSLFDLLVTIEGFHTPESCEDENGGG